MIVDNHDCNRTTQDDDCLIIIMKEKKAFARHEVEANIDKISELNGIFFIDIYTIPKIY